ncbi:MAG: DUF805 domain-containing protein [Thalassolituus sp.]
MSGLVNDPVSCWQVLGLEPTHDQRAIKKAYRALLKEHGPEDDPDMFMRIREAYERAGELARGFSPDTDPERTDIALPSEDQSQEQPRSKPPEQPNQQQSEVTPEPIVSTQEPPALQDVHVLPEPLLFPETQELPEPLILQGEGEIPEAEKDWNASPLIDRMQAIFTSKGWRSDTATWQRLFHDADSLSLAARIEFRAALNYSYLQALDAIIFGRYPEPDVVRVICAELKQDLEVTSLQDIGAPSRELLILTEELLASYDDDEGRRTRRWSLASAAVFKHFFSPIGRTTAGNYFLTLVGVYPVLLYVATLFQSTAWANAAFLSIAIAILTSFVFLSIKRWRDTGRNPLWLGLAVVPVMTVPVLTMLIILGSAPLQSGDGAQHRWPLFRSRQHFSKRLKQALRGSVEEIVS